MLFENQYQLSYATPDLRLGAKILRDDFGMEGFRDLGDAPVIENVVWTPEGDRDIAMRASVAFVGKLMIELLEPVSGAIEIFTEMLAGGQPLTLHHVGMRCDDADAAAAEHERQGRRCVMIGNFRVARFAYIDARATLGHFLEYSSAPPEYWDR